MVLLGLARSGFLKQRRLNPTTRPQGPDGSTDLESRSTTSFLGPAWLTARRGEGGAAGALAVAGLQARVRHLRPRLHVAPRVPVL